MIPHYICLVIFSHSLNISGCLCTNNFLYWVLRSVLQCRACVPDVLENQTNPEFLYLTHTVVCHMSLLNLYLYTKTHGSHLKEGFFDHVHHMIKSKQ